MPIVLTRDRLTFLKGAVGQQIDGNLIRTFAILVVLIPPVFLSREFGRFCRIVIDDVKSFYLAAISFWDSRFLHRIAIFSSSIVVFWYWRKGVAPRSVLAFWDSCLAIVYAISQQRDGDSFRSCLGIILFDLPNFRSRNGNQLITFTAAALAMISSGGNSGIDKTSVIISRCGVVISIIGCII